MVKRSDIENDVKMLMQSFKNDYRIPTSGEIISPIIKLMSVVYMMHFVVITVGLIVCDKKIWFPGIAMWLVLSCGILTVMAIMMAYGNLSLLMCIPKEVREKSLLVNLAKKKLRLYGLIMIVFNTFVAVVLISERSSLIIGYGFSWFASFLIGGVVFSMSMSRYMTPAVVATLDKIRQVVSSPQISSNSEEV
ncbi:MULTISPECIES: hypothetical protein [Enterobacterales]|jgi:hypothetical protein|uniref:Protein traS n=1 Tax=Intestinirhabdus alba TaxID=2899544 RepID=A0A6L6IR78_9ENTR|nr:MULTISPECIES: hypothetical protein [Enterobacterales]MDL4915019.1 hypothetical protein [Mixta mediterraneensis]MTH47520.1 hypothetical protein [Intestinirhabdus alba]